MHDDSKEVKGGAWHRSRGWGACLVLGMGLLLFMLLSVFSFWPGPTPGFTTTEISAWDRHTVERSTALKFPDSAEYKVLSCKTTHGAGDLTGYLGVKVEMPVEHLEAFRSEIAKDYVSVTYVPPEYEVDEIEKAGLRELVVERIVFSFPELAVSGKAEEAYEVVGAKGVRLLAIYIDETKATVVILNSGGDTIYAAQQLIGRWQARKQ